MNVPLILDFLLNLRLVQMFDEEAISSGKNINARGKCLSHPALHHALEPANVLPHLVTGRDECHIDVCQQTHVEEHSRQNRQQITNSV